MFRTRIVATLLTSMLACVTQAQTFPSQPITLVVPQSAGSGGDVVARLLSDKISNYLNTPVVVDNKPGANGVIAMSSVAKANPNGYTILLTGVSQVSFNPHLYQSLPYDPEKDFTYIAPVVDTPFVLVASKKSGLTSLNDLIEKAKAKPGEITFSSAGKGNSTHLATEMIVDKAGISLQHIPYKGSGPALNAVISGEVNLMTSVLGTALPQIQAGTVTPLAVLAANRASDLPDVPTVQQAGLNTEPMPGWYAIVGPKGIPAEIVTRLNEAVQSAVTDPQVDQRLRQLYFVPVAGTAQDMLTRAKKDSSDWGNFIRASGLRID